MRNRVQTGKIGESLARQYLLDQGYQIIEQNWRCRSGEIDLIAMSSDHILIFVEVRTRQHHSTFGDPIESIHYRKQKQVRDTAQVYLHQTRQHHRMVRFDVVTVLFNSIPSNPVIRHIPNAF